MFTRRDLLSAALLSPFAQTKQPGQISDDRVARLEARLASLEQEKDIRLFVHSLRRAVKTAFK